MLRIDTQRYTFPKQIWGGEAATMGFVRPLSLVVLLISDKNELTACHPVSGSGSFCPAPPSWPTVLVLLSVPSTSRIRTSDFQSLGIKSRDLHNFLFLGLVSALLPQGDESEKMKNATVTSHRIARGSGAGIPSPWPPVEFHSWVAQV